MKKELFVFVLISFFITLISLGAQTRYTVVNFGLNQPLDLNKFDPKIALVSKIP